MIETRNPEINIEELKKRIRLAVERRESEGQLSFAKSSAELFDLLSPENFQSKSGSAEDLANDNWPSDSRRSTASRMRFFSSSILISGLRVSIID